MNNKNVHQFPYIGFDDQIGGKGLEILNKLIVQDWGVFFRLGEHISFEHDEVILQQDHNCDAMYFISDGEVRIERDNYGTRVELARLSSGSIFGEMSFLDGASVSADVIADGNVSVFRVDYLKLREKMKFEPEFGQRLYNSLAVTLSRRLRATNKIVGRYLN